MYQKDLRELFESYKEDLNFKQLSDSIEAADFEKVKALLKEKDKLINSALWISAKFGQYKLLKKLLKKKKADPGMMYNIPLRSACAEGHISIVKLLLKHKKVDPADLNYEALWLAAENGHSEIVEILIKDHRLTCRANSVFGDAIKKGHADIVRLLLSYKKVKLDILSHKMLCDAVSDGYIDLVKFILNFWEINLIAGENSPLEIAINNADIEMVAVLLADSRIFPQPYHLEHAIEQGQIKIVTSLINHGLNPHENNNMPINLAAKFGHSEIVQYLLQDPRVNPSNSRAFFWACTKGNLDTVQLLMECSTVNISIGISKSLEYNHLNILRYLLQVHETNLDMDLISRGITKAFEHDYQEIIHQFITAKQISSQMAFSILEQIDEPLCKAFVSKCCHNKIQFLDKIYTFFCASRKILPAELISEIGKTTLNLYETGTFLK